MFRTLARELWLDLYSRLVLRHNIQSHERFIAVRLIDGNAYLAPCAYLPEDGMRAFWHSLGVPDDAEAKLQPEWIKGNLVPVAPDFPVLSWLIQMQIDISTVDLIDLPKLIEELRIGRERCLDESGIAVFDELEKAARLGVALHKGITLSPFG